MDADSWLVGRYQLLRQIGAGGVAEVWAAHDAVLGRDVAVKVQKADPDEDHAAFERFVREARSAAALQHPNVVTIFDSGTDGDTAYLVMELLPGPTLSGYLAQHGPVSEREAVALAAQVASGLAAAHGARVVHRDIKPANLMFDAQGTLKIVDFGIARLTQAVATRLTARNAIIGSPPYLSPEQVQGQPADERSDIYCLGGVMMTMLTGRAPYEGSHSLALLQQHLYEAPPQVRDRRPGIDPTLNALVAQMLSKSRADRPQSAQEVLDRLTGREASARAATAATVLDTGRPARSFSAHPPGRTVAVARPRQRSLLGLGMLAGAAVMAVVAAIVVAVTTTAEAPTARRPEPSPSVSAPVAAQVRQAKPVPRTPTPTVAEVRRPKPAPRVPTASPTNRKSTSRPITPRTADTNNAEQSHSQALAALRAAVDDVSSNDRIDARTADQLDRRVDGLAKHLEKTRGEDATKKLDELDAYVAGLTAKGALPPDDGRRIATALSQLRDVTVNG